MLCYAMLLKRLSLLFEDVFFLMLASLNNIFLDFLLPEKITDCIYLSKLTCDYTFQSKMPND
jgi:hypothetical protein